MKTILVKGWRPWRSHWKRTRAKTCAYIRLHPGWRRVRQRCVDGIVDFPAIIGSREAFHKLKLGEPEILCGTKPEQIALPRYSPRRR